MYKTPTMAPNGHKGGMPSGRYKSGSLGPDKKKIEFWVTEEQGQQIEEAAKYHAISRSNYCAHACVAAAKADLARKLRQ
jgi:uncharacterized protein (DUF1778 family)